MNIQYWRTEIDEIDRTLLQLLNRRARLAMKVGADPGSPEQAIFKEWSTKRYHAPSDDVNQPVDLASAAKFEEIIRALTITVANEPARPAWKPDSFFRRYAQGN